MMSATVKHIVNNKSAWRQAATSGQALVFYLAVFKLALHLLTASNYGLFIDELYFLACGQHLAWGYVDMPPLTAVQAKLAQSLFGASVAGIHLFPALAGAGLVLLTGALVRILGGSRFAQVLAALAILVAPVYLLEDSYLSMNSIEPLIWMGCAYLLIRIVKTGDTRLWLGFGALAGLGLLNKSTMLMFGFALVMGLLLTSARKWMFNRWFVMGGCLAMLIFLPNLIWELQHQFPHLEQLANIRTSQRNAQLSILDFLAQQIIYQHPITFPLWLGGLVYFFIHREGKVFRFLGWSYLITLGILLLTQGRVYYLAPSYPMLLAGGSVAFEELLCRLRWSWVRAASLAVTGITGALMAPFALPLLPPQTYLRYSQLLSFQPPKIENNSGAVLPQLFADRFGWPEMAEAASDVFHSLPPDEQGQTAIFGMNYGEAGAIDFYGPQYGLPKSLSGALTYFYWGPKSFTGSTVIVLGLKEPGYLYKFFSSVEPAAQVHHPYAMNRESFTIYICRDPKQPFTNIWPSLKNWY